MFGPRLMLMCAMSDARLMFDEPATRPLLFLHLPPRALRVRLGLRPKHDAEGAMRQEGAITE